jgi:hypothetical protein
MSDRLGENLYEGTVAAKAKSEEAKEALEDTKETLSQQKLVLEGKVAGLQTRALEEAEEKAIARAERLTQKREAAQLRTVAAAEELSQRQEGKRSKEEMELRSKLKAALSERHFLQDRILRDFPTLKHRNQGAFAQLRKFRSSDQEQLPEAEEILAEGTGKAVASPKPKSFPHVAGAFLLGLAVGVLIMVVLERYSTMLI